MTLVAAVSLAAMAAVGITSLHDRSADAREAKYLLASLRADTFLAQSIQEQAILDSWLSPELDRELRAAVSAGDSRLAELKALEGEGDRTIKVAYTAFRTALQAETAALRAGGIEDLRRIETAQVEPPYDRLARAIDADLVGHEHDADRADQVADGGTVAALGLAALMIFGLGSLRRRSRRTAEALASEQVGLEQSERRFRSLVQQSTDMITVVDADLVPTYNTPSVRRVLGYRDDELSAAAGADQLVHPDDGARVRARLVELVGEAPGHSAVLAYRIKHHDGSWRTVETVATNLLEEPTIAGLVLNSRDVSERTALEGELVHRALHDPLTELANRTLFRDLVEHALARAGRHDQTAVALLDLDNFKAVNDSLGHAAGDDLLVILAGRLQECVRPGDTVARLGGDEFAVLLEATVEIEALGAADRILESLRRPVVVADRLIVIQASIGVASSRQTSDATTMMRNADLAMYAAKALGKGRAEVFHQGMHEAVQGRMELEADLRVALEDALVADQLRLHYQPKVSLADGRITGVEALVRWQHPERGLVSPVEFIPLADETGLIVPIGAWVLEEACRQSATWQAQARNGHRLVMSVNVSVRQFEADLVTTVANVLAATGIEPSTLCLEVTESVVMKDVDRAVATLRDLKALGVLLSIDDFGTGYSSLSSLKQFPLDELKIDKAFVDGLGRDSNADAIVAAVMGVARALQLEVVAEGVETGCQVASLQALGCETAQGFFYCLPKPAADITELLVAGRIIEDPTSPGPAAGTEPRLLPSPHPRGPRHPRSTSRDRPREAGRRRGRPAP